MEAAIIVTFALAGLSVAYAAWSRWQHRRERATHDETVRRLASSPATAAGLAHVPAPDDDGGDRVLAMLVALLLGLAGLAAWVIDEKVGDPGTRAKAKAKAAAPAPRPADTSWPLQDLDAYRGRAVLHAGPRATSMCLVRYYPKGRKPDPGANWWTTCDYNAKLKTVAQVRRVLALPRRWGRRDARVFARIPKGEHVVFLRGRAARQCEPDDPKRCYPGGGAQLLFRDADFHRSWFVRYECAPPRAHSTASFRPCAG